MLVAYSMQRSEGPGPVRYPFNAQLSIMMDEGTGCLRLEITRKKETNKYTRDAGAAQTVSQELRDQQREAGIKNE